MSEGPKKPPPRPPYPRGVDRTEPFTKLTEPSHVELGATQKDIVSRLDEVLASHREILSRQRSMALQLDGYGNIMNQRFDVFHQELAMLRATVTGDHAPRLDVVEVDIEKIGTEVKTVSAAQKAKTAALVTAKFGAWGTGVLFFGGLALRALAKVYPEYGELIEGLLGMAGL